MSFPTLTGSLTSAQTTGIAFVVLIALYNTFFAMPHHCRSCFFAYFRIPCVCFFLPFLRERWMGIYAFLLGALATFFITQREIYTNNFL